MTDNPTPPIVASFYTLSGAPNGEPARHSFEARVRAASNAGYTGIGLSLFDFEACRQAHPPERLREVADLHGIRVAEIEFLAIAPEESLSGPSEAELGLIVMADLFGARHVNVSIARPLADAAATTNAARALSEVAKRCADHDLRVAFEFMPFLSVGTVGDALRIVEAADQPNLGILVDSYHFFRGGSALNELERVDPELIVAFQLSDAPATPPADLLAETRKHRLLPGEGDLDLLALLRAGHASSSSVLGIEVLSDELRALSIDDAATRSFEATATTWERYASSVVPEAGPS